MRKILLILLVLMLITGCNTKNDSNTSELTPEEYFLTGELLEVEGKQVLIDADEVGLVWVTLDKAIDEAISLRSIIKIQYSGAIAESYPAQTSGYFVEVIELFTKEAIYTKEELDYLIQDGDINHVIRWNTTKEYVAFAQIDLGNEGTNYRIYVANIYEEGDTLVDYIEGEMPDLNWFYNILEIQTSSEVIEIAMPYSDSEDEFDYNLVLNEFVNLDKGVSIQYYQVEGIKGELTKDYINQSLYQVVDVFGDNYTNLSMEANILRSDELITIEYLGKLTDMDMVINKYLTIDVASSQVLTYENLVVDKVAFKEIFLEKSGYNIDELEGITPYMTIDKVVFTFVPLADHTEREYVRFDEVELEGVIKLEFEYPAS